MQLAGNVGGPARGQNRAEENGNPDGVDSVTPNLVLEGKDWIIFPAHFLLQNGDAFSRSGGTQMWQRLEESGLVTGSGPSSSPDLKLKMPKEHLKLTHDSVASSGWLNLDSRLLISCL